MVRWSLRVQSTGPVRRGKVRIFSGETFSRTFDWPCRGSGRDHSKPFDLAWNAEVRVWIYDMQPNRSTKDHDRVRKLVAAGAARMVPQLTSDEVVCYDIRGEPSDFRVLFHLENGYNMNEQMSVRNAEAKRREAAGEADLGWHISPSKRAAVKEACAQIQKVFDDEAFTTPCISTPAGQGDPCAAALPMWVYAYLSVPRESVWQDRGGVPVLTLLENLLDGAALMLGFCNAQHLIENTSEDDVVRRELLGQACTLMTKCAQYAADDAYGGMEIDQWIPGWTSPGMDAAGFDCEDTAMLSFYIMHLFIQARAHAGKTPLSLALQQTCALAERYDPYLALVTVRIDDFNDASWFDTPEYCFHLIALCKDESRAESKEPGGHLLILDGANCVTHCPAYGVQKYEPHLPLSRRAISMRCNLRYSWEDMKHVDFYGSLLALFSPSGSDMRLYYDGELGPGSSAVLGRSFQRAVVEEGLVTEDNAALGVRVMTTNLGLSLSVQSVAEDIYPRTCGLIHGRAVQRLKLPQTPQTLCLLNLQKEQAYSHLMLMGVHGVPSNLLARLALRPGPQLKLLRCQELELIQGSHIEIGVVRIARNQAASASVQGRAHDRRQRQGCRGEAGGYFQIDKSRIRTSGKMHPVRSGISRLALGRFSCAASCDPETQLSRDCSLCTRPDVDDEAATEVCGADGCDELVCRDCAAMFDADLEDATSSSGDDSSSDSSSLVYCPHHMGTHCSHCGSETAWIDLQRCPRCTDGQGPLTCATCVHEVNRLKHARCNRLDQSCYMSGVGLCSGRSGGALTARCQDCSRVAHRLCAQGYLDMDDRPLCPMCVQQRHVKGRGGFGGDDEEKEAGHGAMDDGGDDSLQLLTDLVLGREKRKSTEDHDTALADLFDGLQELDDYFEEQKQEEPGPSRKRAAVSTQEITPQVPQPAPRAAAAPPRRALVPAPAPAAAPAAADPAFLALARACARNIVDRLITRETLQTFDYRILALFMTTVKDKMRYDGKVHMERMQNASEREHLDQAKEEAVERLTTRIMRIRKIMPENVDVTIELCTVSVQGMAGDLSVFGPLNLKLCHDVSAAPCVVCVDKQAEKPGYLCTSSALLDYTSHICMIHRKSIHNWFYKSAMKVYDDVPQVVDVKPPDNDVRRELQALAPRAVREQPVRAKQVLQRYVRRHAWMLLKLPANQRRAEDRSAKFVQVPPQMRASVSDLVDQCGLDLDAWLRHPDLPKMRVLLTVMEIANRNQAIWITGMTDIDRAADMDVRHFQQMGEVRFVGGGAGAESKEAEEEEEPSFTSMCLLAQHSRAIGLLEQTRARLRVTGSRRLTEASALEQQRHAMQSELVKGYCAEIRRDLEDTLRLSRDNLLEASGPTLDQAYCLLLAIYQSRGGRAGPGQWPQPSVLLGRAHGALVVQPAPMPAPLPVLPNVDTDVHVHARPHTPDPPSMDNVWGADGYDLEFDPEPLPPDQFDPGPSSPDEFDLLSLLDQKPTRM